MVNQVLLVLILQIVFFVFYYKFGFSVAKIIGRRVCPVCFAVGSAWAVLLVIKYLGIMQINKFLIAMLLTESLVGVSYLVEEFIVIYQVRWPEPLLKFGIIVYGTSAVSVFTFGWEILGLILFFPIIIFGFFSLTPMARILKQESLPLKTKLKNCC